MNFDRIEHINKVCQNLEVTRQFYQILFPDWFVRASGDYDGSRWLHFGNDRFYLSLYERQNSAQPVPLHTGNIDHIGFVIEDGEAMMALLQSKGIEHFVEDAPETKYRIYVNDPDNTMLELVEYQQDYALR